MKILRHPIKPTSPYAFTLIELLVVLSIITGLVAISFPTLGALRRSTSISLAVDTVSNSVAAGRVYAVQQKQFVTGRRIGNSVRTAETSGDGYSGSIVLFAPDGTVRIAQNDEDAWWPSLGWMELLTPVYNGFRQIEDLDDLTISSRAVVLGLTRIGPGDDDVALLPPPFALHFDRDGVLTQGLEIPGRNYRYVYYSGEGRAATRGGVADVLDYRAMTYRPTSFTDTLSVPSFGRNGSAKRDVDGRTQLPWDAVETVSGVVVLDPQALPSGLFTNINLPESNDEWASFVAAIVGSEARALLDFAQQRPDAVRVIFFNRYTGQDLNR